MPGQGIKRARRLRQDQTIAEEILWQRLRGKKTLYKFRRQHPIGPYIVDFFCSEAKLVVELDGMTHDKTKSRDEQRRLYLESLGFSELRFDNALVFGALDMVVEEIVRSCERSSWGCNAILFRYYKAD